MKSLPPMVKAAAAVIILTILYACFWAVTHPVVPPLQRGVHEVENIQLPTLPLSQGGVS